MAATARVEIRLDPEEKKRLHEVAEHRHASVSDVVRDLVHLAVMRRAGCTHIVTADRGFDGLSGIQRLDPLDVDRWAPDLGLRR